MARSSAEGMGTPEELLYWVPGEMIVVVQLPRRPAAEALELLAEQVRRHLNTLLAPYDLTLEPYGTHGRWLASPALPPVKQRAFLLGLQRSQPLAALFFHARHADPSVLDPMPLAIAHLQVNLELLAQQGLYLVSSMPNWLVTAAPLLYSAGGPALPPRPAPLLDLATAANSPLGWHISFADQGVLLDPNGAEDVLVAVLDTAPHADRVLSIAARPEYRRNWLLQRLATNLRSENGSFEIEYDRYPLSSDVRTGRDRYGESQYYPLPDHGLFVSGLIRDIAPRARIRLVRILNDYGGCDLYNLFAALTDLEKELSTGSIRRLIVNLSLTVMPDLWRLPYIWFDHRKWESPQLASVTRVLSHIEEGLHLLFESLAAQGALLVAAAGNDSQQSLAAGKRPRPPRIPACYPSVVSVTSVNSRFEPARYANAACAPPVTTGVATFGGDVDGLKDANELPDAVRGLYLAPAFPNGEPNATGWADWSGSSFATPIISALGAHLLAQGWSAEQARTRLTSGNERRSELLYGAPPEVPGLLAHLVRAQQRFEL